MDIIRLANIFYGMIKRGEKNVGKYIEQRFYQEFGYDVYPPGLIKGEGGKWETKEGEEPIVRVINRGEGDIKEEDLVFYINGKEVGGDNFYKEYRDKVMNGRDFVEEGEGEGEIVYNIIHNKDYKGLSEEEAIEKVEEFLNMKGIGFSIQGIYNFNRVANLYIMLSSMGTHYDFVFVKSEERLEEAKKFPKILTGKDLDKGKDTDVLDLILSDFDIDGDEKEAASRIIRWLKSYINHRIFV